MTLIEIACGVFLAIVALYILTAVVIVVANLPALIARLDRSPVFNLILVVGFIVLCVWASVTR